jgi:hypothetical protein
MKGTVFSLAFKTSHHLQACLLIFFIESLHWYFAVIWKPAEFLLKVDDPMDIDDIIVIDREGDKKIMDEDMNRFFCIFVFFCDICLLCFYGYGYPFVARIYLYLIRCT